MAWPALLTAQIAGRHPDPQYIRAPSVPGFKAALSDPARPAPFRLGPASAQFGSESDPDSLLLGDILAATFLPGGSIAVLDDKLFHLRIFDAAARPLQALGREGGGPGEFTGRLTSITADSSGNVLVADLSRSVRVFRPSKTGYRYDRSTPLGVSPLAMCLLSPSLMTVGLLPGHPEVLHAFTPDSTRRADFGLVYQAPNLALNYSFNQGILTCDPARSTAYFATKLGFADVRAYRVDGTPEWRTTVDGLISNVVEEMPRGYKVTASGRGVHSVRSLTLLPGYGLLLQIAYRSEKDLEDGTWYSTLTSFLIDPSSGRPAPLGTTLPLIVAATRTRVLVIGEDPVPHFEIRALLAP